MSDLARLEELFAGGRLVRPGGARPDLVDFSRAIYSLAGAEGLALSPEAARLGETIGPAEHYVFVLIDGLGCEMLERAPQGGFLREHVAEKLGSVFPATTAAALTSLATAEHPARHGVTGWWLRLVDYGISATILPFVERFSERDLRELGVDPDKVFTVPSAVARLAHRPLAVLPEKLVGSVYSTYSAGGTAQAGYAEPPEAFELAVRNVAEAHGPTLTYVYLPQADALAHEGGVQAEEVVGTLAALDGLLADMSRRLGGGARVIVTGDHGLHDIPDEHVFFLDEGDPLANCLSCPPTGEPAVPFFHAREGRGEEFARSFRERWGGDFALLTSAEVEKLSLMGPGPLGPEAAARIGDFVAIPCRAATIRWRPKGGGVNVHRGEHGGLTPAEMTVPLILA